MITQSVTSGQGNAAVPAVALGAAVRGKLLDLAISKRDAADYLDFLDATKEAFFGYLYHRTGSMELARTLLREVYLDQLARAMSFWRFGGVTLKALLDRADHAVRGRSSTASDLDSTYLKSLPWCTDEEKKSVATLHDALWTLPRMAQELLILSLLVGLPNEKIALSLRLPLETLEQKLQAAKELLLARWQPPKSLLMKLNSLAFIPGLDLRFETTLRMSVVEKYNALRFRRYQWVVIGGLFAVLSNIIVASVLAFAVVVEPPTTLRGTRAEVASMDALLLSREISMSKMNRSLAASFVEARRIVAYDVTRDFTGLGLAAALESLQHEQVQESEVNRLIQLMKRARVAIVETGRIVAALLGIL